MEIVRKDGIKYERKAKTRNYDSIINIRVSKDMIEVLKQMASKYGTKYNTLVREILEDYIELESEEMKQRYIDEILKPYKKLGDKE